MSQLVIIESKKKSKLSEIKSQTVVSSRSMGKCTLRPREQHKGHCLDFKCTLGGYPCDQVTLESPVKWCSSVLKTNGPWCRLGTSLMSADSDADDSIRTNPSVFVISGGKRISKAASHL